MSLKLENRSERGEYRGEYRSDTWNSWNSEKHLPEVSSNSAANEYLDDISKNTRAYKPAFQGGGGSPVFHVPSPTGSDMTLNGSAVNYKIPSGMGHVIKSGDNVAYQFPSFTDLDGATWGSGINFGRLGLGGIATYTHAAGWGVLASIFGWGCSEVQVRGTGLERDVSVSYKANGGVNLGLFWKLPEVLACVIGKSISAVTLRPGVSVDLVKKRTFEFKANAEFVDSCLSQGKQSWVKEKLGGPDISGFPFPDENDPSTLHVGQKLTIVRNSNVKACLVGNVGCLGNETIQVGCIGGVEKNRAFEVEYVLEKVNEKQLSVTVKVEKGEGGKAFMALLGLEGGVSANTSMSVEQCFIITDIHSTEGQERLKELLSGTVWGLSKDTLPQRSDFVNDKEYLNAYSSHLNTLNCQQGLICDYIQCEESYTRCMGLGFSFHVPLTSTSLFGLSVNQIHRKSVATKLSGLDNRGVEEEVFKSNVSSVIKRFFRGIYIDQVSTVQVLKGDVFGGIGVRVSVFAQNAKPSKVIQQFIAPLNEHLKIEDFESQGDLLRVNREIHATYFLEENHLRALSDIAVESLRSTEKRLQILKSVADSCAVPIENLLDFLAAFHQAKGYDEKEAQIKNYILQNGVAGFSSIGILLDSTIDLSLFTEDYDNVIESGNQLIEDYDKFTKLKKENVFGWGWYKLWDQICWYQFQYEIYTNLRDVKDNLDLLYRERSLGKYLKNNYEKSLHDLKDLEEKLTKRYNKMREKVKCGLPLEFIHDKWLGWGSKVALPVW